MKTKISRRTLCLPCLLVSYVLVFLSVGTVQSQRLPRFFSHRKPPVQKVSPEVLQAFRPSESDLEAAKNARNALIDTERAAQYAPVEIHHVKRTPEIQESLESIESMTPEMREIMQEKIRKIVESPPRPIPNGNDLTPQVCMETRFIGCSSQSIAPKGMLAEQGWVLLPVAQEQKVPAALRVRDLIGEDNTNMAAGAIHITEQYFPTLIRFIDTKEFPTIEGHIMSDARNNILMPPKVTTISGQPGELSDTMNHLYTWINSKDNAAVEELWNGWSVKFHPEVLEDGSVRMKELQAVFTMLAGEKSYTLDPEGEVVLKIPKLQTRRFNLPITIPAGKTLLAAVPCENDWREMPKGTRVDDRPNTFCLAVTCHVFTSEMIAENMKKVAKSEQP